MDKQIEKKMKGNLFKVVCDEYIYRTYLIK